MTHKKIVGAGLSGLTAAINLAKAGYKVDVYEENNDSGTRFNGDLQGLENWSDKKDILQDLRDMNIKTRFECTPFSKLNMTNCKKGNTLKTEKPLFYLVKRGSFPGTLDYCCKELALESGVKIHFGKTLPAKDADIISAGPIQKKVVAIDEGIVFRTNLKNMAHVVINDELAYKGYSYLLVTNGYACMCSVVFNDLGRIEGCFEKTRKYYVKRYNLKIRSAKKVGGVGCFTLNNIFTKGKTLYTGESAGFQDFLWGFGMRYAITSGYLAAKSIINNEDYEKLARKRFGNKLKAGAINRYLWEKLSGNEYSKIINHLGLLKKNIYSLSNYNVLQRVMSPFAISYLMKKYKKIS